MASPLFTMTAYEITSLVRASSSLVLAQRMAALAAKYGVSVEAIKDAVWATGTLVGQGARNVAVRATAQSLARGAAQRIGQMGGQQVARQVAAQGARSAVAGGIGASLGTIGTVLGIGLVVVVLAGGAYAAHRIYTTMQQRAATQTRGVIDPDGGGWNGSGGETDGGVRMTDVRGRWVVDAAAIVDDQIRRGAMSAAQRSRALAAWQAEHGGAILELRSGAVAVSTSRLGTFQGRWSRSGSVVEVRRGSWVGRYRIQVRHLTISNGAMTMFYRRA